MLRPVSILFVLFISSYSALAHADVAAVELRYQAPAACPDRGAFADEVAARLGYVPFALVASDWVRVSIAQDGATWLATIEGSDGSARVLRANDCAELVRVASTALAVQFDTASRASVNVAPANSAIADFAAMPMVSGTVVPSGPTVAVDVRSNVPDVTLYTANRTSPSGPNTRVFAQDGYLYASLCTAPCTLQLSLGEHRFAITEPQYSLLHADDQARTIDGPARIDITFNSRASLRHAGGWTMGLGVLAAVVLAFLPLMDSNVGLWPTLGSSIGALTLGFTVGGILAAQHDAFELEISPR